MIVYVVVDSRGQFCCVYSSREIAMAWINSSILPNQDWHLFYRIYETEVCEIMPQD